jgi:thiamine biosynthesis lipoprotein
VIPRAICTALVACLAHGAAAATVTEVHYVMGTYFRITAQHDDVGHARASLRRCCAAARRADELFSRFDPDSELSRLNRASDEAVRVNADMAALLQRALHLRAATGGAFDVGIGALTGLWRGASVWPSPPQIEAVKPAAGGAALTLDGSVVHRRPGVLVDLDGIAKGWTVDRCASQLRADGIERALLSLGESSLFAIGAPAGRRGWDVMLRDLDPEKALGTLRLRDAAVSVSAVFGHERQVGRRRVGHIIDPRSGAPLTSPGMAVVVAPSATDAEAFSKALLIRSDEMLRHLSGPTETDGVIINGALLVRPGGVRRAGRVPLSRFRTVRPIRTAVEPLR